TILFVGPLMAKREMVAPWLIKLLFYAVIVIVVWNFFTQLLAAKGIAGWWLGQPWLQNGLEYIEVGRLAGIGILVGFGIFTYVVLRTIPPLRQCNELHYGIGLGVTFLFIACDIVQYYVVSFDVQQYFCYYVRFS